MRPSILNFTIGEVLLTAISFMEFLNEYIRLIAAITATVSFVFVVVKFFRDERDRKKRNKLLELQIENEINKRKTNENNQ